MLLFFSARSSNLEIITAPQLSLNTFAVVLNISRILSTASMIATPSRGRPTAHSIIDIITIPLIGILAAPIDASTAVIATVIWAPSERSKPYTWAIKIVATHS